MPMFRHSPPPPAGDTLRLLALAAFLSLTTTRLCDAMLPALAQSFGTTTVEASATISAYAVGYGLTQLLWGPLGDRHGKLRVMTLATLACVMSTLAAAWAPSLQALVAARAVMGAAPAALFPLGLAWVSDHVPLAQRQQALARFSGISVFGMVLGPALGGLLADLWSWRGAFLAMSLAFGLMAVLIGARAQAAETGGELVGDAASAVTTARPRQSAPLRGLLAASWTQIVFTLACVEAGLMIGGLALVPTVLHDHFGLTLTQAGAAVAAFGLGGFAFSRCSAWMLRRIPRLALPPLGAVLCASGVGALAVTPDSIWAIGACGLAGLGFFMLHNTLQVQATQLAPESTGLAMSLFTAAIFVGQSAGVWAAAMAYPHFGRLGVFSLIAAGLLTVGVVWTVVLARRARPAAG